MKQYRRDQFESRAKSVFVARIILDSLGILFLLIPAWGQSLVAYLPKGLAVYLFLLFGHLFSFLWIGKKFDRFIYFITLCFDLIALVFVVVLTGGLSSPVMSGHLLYAVFFAILYPHPLAILPALLLLPIIPKISTLLGTAVGGRDLLLLLWYSGIDLIIVYVVVYFDLQENMRFRKALELEEDKRELSLINERQRIAREMHDGLGALLSTIKIQAEFLSEFSKDNPEIQKEAELLQSRSQSALEELRRTVRIMREDFELLPALEELIQNMQELYDYKISFVYSLQRSFDNNYGLHIYRIIQESLTNTGKHAQATLVEINLEDDCKLPFWIKEQNLSNDSELHKTKAGSFSSSGVLLEIKDNGCGFSTSKKTEGHFGLLHIKERVEEMNGQIKITSISDKGTDIKIWFP
ncbi:MAG: sensor histidine kinase [Myxococcota bacterium]